MQDFKIRRGLSTVLFSEPGIVNPKLVIEVGCWYLTTDTAELYVGIKSNGVNALKKINGNTSASTPDNPSTPDIEIVSIDHIDINNSGELVVYYSNNTFVNLGKVVGSDGKDGVDGKDGKDGVDGQPGLDGKDGKDGIDGKDGTDGKTPYIKDGNWWIGDIDTGIKAEGVDGKDGINGKDGVDGKDGKDGKDGLVTSIKINDLIYDHENGIITLPEFITSDYLDEKLADVNVDLSEYVTQTELTNYASKGYVDEKLELLGMPDIDLEVFVKKEDLDAYLTEVPEEYITEEELNNKGFLRANSFDVLILNGGTAL